MLAEALLLALVGGVLGAVGAWAFFDGYRTSTLNWDSFSQVTFAFDVTPALLVLGALFASCWVWSAACSPRSARRACRSPRRCARRDRAA